MHSNWASIQTVLIIHSISQAFCFDSTIFYEYICKNFLRSVLITYKRPCLWYVILSDCCGLNQAHNISIRLYRSQVNLIWGSFSQKKIYSIYFVIHWNWTKIQTMSSVIRNPLKAALRKQMKEILSTLSLEHNKLQSDAITKKVPF